jgi:uncharacterized membrane protein
MSMNGTIMINRPVGVVYDYVMDVSNDANWRTGLTESAWRSDEPAAVGSIGYTRAGDQEAEWQIVSFTPGESIDWEFLTGPFKGRGGYRFQPVEGGTQFTLVADVTPTGALRFLGPLFGWVARRQNQADVEKLRDILESMAG